MSENAIEKRSALSILMKLKINLANFIFKAHIEFPYFEFIKSR